MVVEVVHTALRGGGTHCTPTPPHVRVSVSGETLSWIRTGGGGGGGGLWASGEFPQSFSFSILGISHLA